MPKTNVYDMTGKKMYQGKTGFDLDLKINSDYKYFILSEYYMYYAYIILLFLFIFIILQIQC